MANRLQWNAGGWFGSQLGPTCWIRIAVVLAALQDSRTGLVLAAVFAMPNIIGLTVVNLLATFCFRFGRTR